VTRIRGECRTKFAYHLDCFAWVKRDSYLPQGSQGLKVQYVGFFKRLNFSFQELMMDKFFEWMLLRLVHSRVTSVKLPKLSQHMGK
jgi:hypothetical protein